MSCNVIKEYVDFSKKNFLEYSKLMMGKYFDRTRFDQYLNVYIETRYYHDNPMVKSTLEANLNYYLGLVYEKDKSKVSKFILELFKMFYYLDNVKKFPEDQDLLSYVKELNQVRTENLRIKDDDFIQKFSHAVKENTKRKEKFLKEFSTTDFYLKTIKLEKQNIYYIKLQHHLTIPKLYSDYAINRVYQSGLVAEDKLFVEYYLLNRIILEDMIKGNFQKEYIAEFQTNMLSKKEKTKNLLTIMDNDLAKELISLRINYQDFITNKEIIYDLMREGYQFTLIIDDTFKKEKNNLEKLDVFKYLLIEQEQYLTKDLLNKSNLLKLN